MTDSPEWNLMFAVVTEVLNSDLDELPPGVAAAARRYAAHRTSPYRGRPLTEEQRTEIAALVRELPGCGRPIRPKNTATSWGKRKMAEYTKYCQEHGL